MRSAVRMDGRRGDLLATLDAAAEGDQSSIRDFVRHCLPQITDYVARRGAANPDALANLVINEFLQNVRRLRFESPERMWSYIYRIAQSRLIDEQRKPNLETSSDTIEWTDQQSSQFDDQVVNKLWLGSLLSELTDDQRQVIEHRFIEDLSLEETAKRAGKSLTAVKALQRRAIAALAAAAAIAAAVIIAILVADAFESAASRVSSTDPARRSSGITDSEQPNVVIETGETDRTGDDESGLAPATDLDSGSTMGQAVRWRPSDGPPNHFGPATTTAQDAQTASGSTPTTGLSAASSTTSPNGATSTSAGQVGPPGQPGSDGRPGSDGQPGPVGSTTTTNPDPGLPSIPDPGAPQAVDDSVLAQFSIEGRASVTFDPLANDLGEYLDATSIKIIEPASLGIVLGPIVGADGSVTMRFFPTGSGSGALVYEVCDIDNYCDQGTVALAATWYDESLCSSLVPTIVGTAGDDVLTGTDGPDIIFGLGGNDTITAGKGADIVCAGDGNDTVHGESGRDLLYGQQGDDSVYGDADGDLIFGGAGNDELMGSTGDDWLYGGGEDDGLNGGPGNDVLYGEAGDDDLFGRADNDWLFGGSGIDWIFGGPGNDQLYGEAGDDEIEGNDGDDVMVGGPGNDVAEGGAGVDQCDADQASQCQQAVAPAVASAIPGGGRITSSDQ